MGRVFVSVALAALLAAGCGAGDGSSGGGGAKGLEVTRDDGSRIDLPDPVRAWCAQEKEFKETDSTEQELFVLVGVGEWPSEELSSHPPFLIFAHPTKAIERMPKVQLPDDEVGYPALFVFDSKTENELSSSVEGSKGSVEVEDWGCDKGDPVRISFTATLDSEFLEVRTVDLSGEIVTVIGDAPAPPE